MKTLVLIRHAKSSWKHEDLKDAERPLKKRGIKDAPRMAKALRKLKATPDLIVSSPAVRAEATARLIAKQINFDKKILIEPALYLDSVSGLMKHVQNIDDTYDTVYWVGHNPGLTDLANVLGDKFVENIPTTGAYGITFEVETWNETGEAKGHCIFFDVPANHRKAKTS
jgi:phosphohistidine phosphatase